MSLFWMRKMRTYFTRIDFDNDGVVTRKDFEVMGNRFVDSGKLSADKASQLKENLNNIWDRYLKGVGGGDAISQNAFIESMKSQVSDPKLEIAIKGPLPLFFYAVDDNKDDQISKDEYEDFFSILGLDSTLAEQSFKAIDENHDGILSMKEFVDAGTDFFLSEDESKPSKLFWGPLVD